MCELHERAVRPNFRLWDGLPDGRISIHGCAGTGLAERNWLTNRARKNFATGPAVPGQGLYLGWDSRIGVSQIQTARDAYRFVLARALLRNYYTFFICI